jgi:hypothetical protein
MRHCSGPIALLLAAGKASGLVLDRRELADEALDVYGAALIRGLASRQRPSVEAAILDLSFRDVIGDPVGSVRNVHERFELPFSAEHERRIEAFGAQHPRGKHHVDPAACGYTEERFRARFPEYYARFGDRL